LTASELWLPDSLDDLAMTEVRLVMVSAIDKEFISDTELDQ
jgi:hypothetical protein